MSYDTHKNWVYKVEGKNIKLWQVSSGASVVELAGYNIRLPADSRGSELIYPSETIENGLMFTGTAFVEPFVEEELETTTAYASGTNISFALSGTRITTDNTNNFWDTTSGFAAGDKIRVKGSASNDADYTIDSFGGSGNSNMVVSGSTLTDENIGERITITQIPKETTTPSVESSDHVNCTRMISLAIVDYIKSQIAERAGNVELKEYFMREFWSKVSDNESNRSITAVIIPKTTYSVI